MKFREALGEVLREQRTSKNLTLREVSIMANISLGYLSEVERGCKEISSEYFYGIAKALETTPSFLVIETGYKMSSYELLDVSLDYETIVTDLLLNKFDLAPNNPR